MARMLRQFSALAFSPTDDVERRTIGKVSSGGTAMPAAFAHAQHER